MSLSNAERQRLHREREAAWRQAVHELMTDTCDVIGETREWMIANGYAQEIDRKLAGIGQRARLLAWDEERDGKPPRALTFCDQGPMVAQFLREHADELAAMAVSPQRVGTLDAVTELVHRDRVKAGCLAIAQLTEDGAKWPE